MFRLVGARVKNSGSAIIQPSQHYCCAFHTSSILALAAATAAAAAPPPSSSAGGKKTTTSTTSRDTRIAGRLRFYKHVGVEELQAPWENAGKKTDSSTSVASPISAGVDGTDSASGVHRPSSSSSLSDSTKLKYMLSPRAPGATAESSQSDSSLSSSSTRWFGISLDGRTLNTPMGKKLVVPSETLAYMIAAEWQSQGKKLRPVDMPLMTLACTALDQVAHHPQVYRQDALRFLSTDTTCFWADPIEHRVLHRKQNDAWKDLHEFVKERLDHAPALAVGASEGMILSRTHGDAKPTAGLPHPPDLTKQAIDWTHSLDAWHLVSFTSMCSQSKSFLVSWGMMQPKSPVRNVQKALEASRVEEEFQIAQWGLVEGGHDYDRLNCSIELHAAHLFAKTIGLDNDLIH